MQKQTRKFVLHWKDFKFWISESFQIFSAAFELSDSNKDCKVLYHQYHNVFSERLPWDEKSKVSAILNTDFSVNTD